MTSLGGLRFLICKVKQKVRRKFNSSTVPRTCPVSLQTPGSQYTDAGALGPRQARYCISFQVPQVSQVCAKLAFQGSEKL